MRRDKILLNFVEREQPKRKGIGGGMDEGSGNKKHIILVHGACHGAWSWHKVTTLLRSAGYRVTAPDLAASGIDERRFQDLRTFTDYTQPLLDVVASLPPGERVVLVGHSLGGMNIALAMDRFPEKIAAAVFVAAFMPDSVNPPSYVLDKVRRSAKICHSSHLCPGCNPNSHWCMPSATFLLHRQLKQEKTLSYWLDTQFGSVVGDKERGPTSMLFGPEFLSKLYKLSPPEDLTLAMTLARPSSFFLEDLGSVPPFSESGYGSVEKVYVVCAQDEGISEGFQRWMIENNPVKVVKEMEDADHMPMFSTPKQLFQCLSDVADAST
ncbi:Polyneuridine-aldehyde esterase [Musa troglodytarum]|uniref:Polyneuridine-aldehyde esterase n=1 Tax=Musa troglodytarum TaxID=320322 RepID=A0A9E7FIB3_9LILI|nr:Polyneuridine-aldehyde esterase [Musa troglodytarum]